jgi:peroxiredoxin
MSIFHELVKGTIDLGTKNSKKLKSIKLDDKIKDWNLLLSSKREVNISSLVKNGPLLLIFIRGTWCPFCRMHMTKLRSWVKKLSGINATIVVVSSEPVDVIKNWLEDNPFPYLFASMMDMSCQIILV